MTDFSEQNPPVSKPCRECPWRRHSLSGFLGPHSADEWIEMVQSDTAIACHMAIQESESWEGAKQCAGAASFRANIAKSPRDPRVARGPNRDDVFSHPTEFKAHHRS